MLLFALSLSVCAQPTPKAEQPGPFEAIYGYAWKTELGQFELLKLKKEESTRPGLSPDGARVYIGARKGRLEARAMSNGALLWAKNGLGDFGFDMIEYQALLLVGIDSDLVAYGRSLGEERWRVPLGGRIGGFLAREGPILVAPVRPNDFVAIDLQTQTRLWQVKRPTPQGLTIRGQAGAFIDAKRQQVYLGFSDGTVQAVRLRTGDPVWQIGLGNESFFPDVDATPFLGRLGTEEPGLVVSAYNEGLFVLDPETGGIRNRVEQKRIIGMIQGPEIVVAVHGDGEVLGFSPRTAQLKWRYLLSGAPSQPILLPGGDHVAVSASEGPLAILRLKDGKPVQFIHPGSGSNVPVSAVGTGLVTLSNAGLLLAMRTTRVGASFILR